MIRGFRRVSADFGLIHTGFSLEEGFRVSTRVLKRGSTSFTVF